jgi:hypothetical protein
MLQSVGLVGRCNSQVTQHAPAYGRARTLLVQPTHSDSLNVATTDHRCCAQRRPLSQIAFDQSPSPSPSPSQLTAHCPYPPGPHGINATLKHHRVKPTCNPRPPRLPIPLRIAHRYQPNQTYAFAYCSGWRIRYIYSTLHRNTRKKGLVCLMANMS